jgi:hypothetical protein
LQSGRLDLSWGRSAILAQLGFDETEMADIIKVFASRSGGYDCEIPFKVAEDSRLRSRYWKSRFHDLQFMDARGSPLSVSCGEARICANVPDPIERKIRMVWAARKQ